jgi:hypothetical protein
LVLTIDNVDLSMNQAQLQANLPQNIAVNAYQDVISSTQTLCPTGFYCPADTTQPVPCPAGTYNNLQNKSAVSDCKACPPGRYCQMNSTFPTDCSSGSFRDTAGAASQVDCTTCTPGNYCPVASVSPTPCFIGTYNPNAGRDNDEDCQVCDIGRYSLTMASATNCPLCQANSYCPNSTSIKVCPLHTVSAEGSSSLLHCRCEKGFVCSYTKIITAVITLNTSVSSFNDPNNPVRGAFITAVSKAAGVSTSNVIIQDVRATPGSRRLLSKTPDSESNDQFINIHTTIHGATHLQHLKLHLAGHSTSLHQGHSWQEAHTVASYVKI